MGCGEPALEEGIMRDTPRYTYASGPERRLRLLAERLMLPPARGPHIRPSGLEYFLAHAQSQVLSEAQVSRGWQLTFCIKYAIIIVL